MTSKPIEQQLGELLRQHHLKLALAESCTGGLASHLMTNLPGSSAYFPGGIVAYAYEAKVHLLGVRWETLNAFGAVSRETVMEMAIGARRALGADLGVSISGIAGPDGGTPEKPVGTTWIGLDAPTGSSAWLYHWQGDRLSIKAQSANEALRRAVEYLAALP